MNEIETVEHLSYGKDELQTTDDIIREDGSEKTIPNAIAATNPLNEQDYMADLQIESMRLTGDYPTKPERRTSLDECSENATEILTEDTIPGPENWEQQGYNQNNLSGKGFFRKAHSLVEEETFLDHQTEVIQDAQEELQDDTVLGIDEFARQTSKQNRHDFMSYDYDKFNSSFAKNSIISNGSENQTGINYTDNSTDNIANDMSTKTRNNDLSPNSTIPNDTQYNILAKRINDFESNNYKNDETNESDNNLKNVLSKERISEEPTRKRDDIRKISSKLEAFSKNNEIPSTHIRASRPKIEETEMPTKGFSCV
uniref:Uncharacterized protein n=1 Tax=Setaria digitata TaxID=48799 RepID=A0A915PM34_9BILA